MLLFNIFSYIKFGNSYQIQDQLWAGSSAAFILVLFCYFLFFNYDKVNYKLNSKYTYSIILYIFIININDTRLGVLYLSSHIFLIFRLIKLKKFITTIVIISLFIPIYQIASYTGFLDSYFFVRKQNYTIQI